MSLKDWHLSNDPKLVGKMSHVALWWKSKLDGRNSMCKDPKDRKCAWHILEPAKRPNGAEAEWVRNMRAVGFQGTIWTWGKCRRHRFITKQLLAAPQSSTPPYSPSYNLQWYSQFPGINVNSQATRDICFRCILQIRVCEPIWKSFSFSRWVEPICIYYYDILRFRLTFVMNMLVSYFKNFSWCNVFLLFLCFYSKICTWDLS